MCFFSSRHAAASSAKAAAAVPFLQLLLLLMVLYCLLLPPPPPPPLPHTVSTHTFPCPAVYLAVNTFVDNALIIISDACAMPPPTFSSNSIGGSGTGPPGSSAAAAGQGLGGLTDQQGLDARLRSVWLRQSVAEYVLEGFLPQLWVDLRGR